MRNTNSLLSLGAVLACAAVTSHCDKISRQDDPRARATIEQGNQRAAQLRNQADQVEHAARDQAHQQAQGLRAEADRVQQRARENADAIRNQDRATSQDTRDHSGVVVNTDRGVTPVARGGGPAALTDAMNQYARARCEREVRCNNVGVGRTFRDVNTCMTSQVNDRSHDWEAANECRANGVNATQLSECVTAARNDDCSNPFDDVSRATACRAAEVCGR